MTGTWRWAALTPIVCAIHCAATPFLLALAPASGALAGMEMWFWGSAGVLAGGALLAGIRKHGRPIVAVPVLAGFALWVGAHAGSHAEMFAPLAEGAATAASTVALAAGLFWNARSACRASERGADAACRCPTCDGASGEEGVPTQGAARAVELAR